MKNIPVFKNQYDFEGKWYKGNLHAHCNQKDGVFQPEEMVDAYRQAGHDFLGITDHNIVTEATHYSSADFLVINSEEVLPHHIVALVIGDW